jgi:hypothetical protein
MNFINSITRRRGLFLAILLLGIAARLWEFGSLPPGLNQDEAAIGVEASSLFHFGVDRNGLAYPVHFISWGSGQNALYAYLLLPFMVFGLNPVTVRLPMLLTGILTLPLLYFVAQLIAGRSFAMISMFLLAISPWHIMLSRWGLESNVLPFVFLASFAGLVRARPDNAGFVSACIGLALCLYAYGTAYAAVPIFMAFTLVIMLIFKRVRVKQLVIGLMVFGLLAIPIGLFFAINTLQWDTLRLGPLSIPRLPVQPRYETMSALFSNDAVAALTGNLRTMFKLLYKQTDGLIWNVLQPYGYFYAITFPIAALGALLLIPLRTPKNAANQWLLHAWLVAALVIGCLQPVNINRLNLIFIPLLLCVAAVLTWLGDHFKPGLIVAICVLCVGFTAFTHDYHAETYRRSTDGPFFTGFLSAIDFARQAGSGPLCVTGKVDMPYIFVLFVEQLDPARYLDSLIYVNPESEFRRVLSFGRYTFGLSHCPHLPGTIYILSPSDTYVVDSSYTLTSFDSFRVYTP